MAISPSEWQWFGHAGHFICGHWCRFHLCTQVGEYLVSTVGMYVPLHRSGGSERTETEWLLANPNGEGVGCGRMYETMVFKAGVPCESADCNCGLPTLDDPSGLDMLPANTAGDARANHMTLCKRYAAMGATPDTGPSADEIERRARALAGELLTDMEVSMGPVLVDLRAKLQEAIKQDAEAYAQNPTTDERVLGYREGDEVATRMVLRLIDEAMETTGETEDDEQKGIT